VHILGHELRRQVVLQRWRFDVADEDEQDALAFLDRVRAQLELPDQLAVRIGRDADQPPVGEAVGKFVEPAGNAVLGEALGLGRELKARGAGTRRAARTPGRPPA
jgi:hypothetical protein